MIVIIFGLLLVIAFAGYLITFGIEYSYISHFIWGVAVMLMTICFFAALDVTIATSDIPDWVKFLLLK